MGVDREKGGKRVHASLVDDLEIERRFTRSAHRLAAA